VKAVERAAELASSLVEEVAQQPSRNQPEAQT
jgi:hypothetical protein